MDDRMARIVRRKEDFQPRTHFGGFVRKDASGLAGQHDVGKKKIDPSTHRTPQAIGLNYFARSGLDLTQSQIMIPMPRMATHNWLGPRHFSAQCRTTATAGNRTCGPDVMPPLPEKAMTTGCRRAAWWAQSLAALPPIWPNEGIVVAIKMMRANSPHKEISGTVIS